MYNCDEQKISALLSQFKIINTKPGKGNRPLLLPIEFEMLKRAIGEPIKR